VTSMSGLLAALAGAPSLPGARCRGRHVLFDEAAPGESVTTTDARQRQAVAMCQRCPSLARCSTWLASLPPPNRPPGVVAGRITQSRPPGRPRIAQPTKEIHP